MKILHVYKTSILQTHGGVESFIDTLCQSTAEFGVQNTVLCLAKSPTEANPIIKNGYTIYTAKELIHLASTGFSLEAFKCYKMLLKNHDIIHYHFPNPFADLLHFVNMFSSQKKPSIVTYHSDIIKQKYLLRLYQPLMHYFLKSVNRIVATSPNYLASSPILGRYKHKTHVIPIGINLEHCKNPSEEKRDYWRKRIGKPFFLFIGALRYYKGLHTALEAIHNTDLQLVIAGNGGPGSVEADLREQAQQLNLNNLHMIGTISDEDKAALLSLCTAFVFPSHLRSEAFGIALLEAAAYGKPMISCEIGTGTSYVNLNHETGFVIEPGSPEALRAAMLELEKNTALRACMSNAAYRRAQVDFDAKKASSHYINAYEQLMKDE